MEILIFGHVLCAHVNLIAKTDKCCGICKQKFGSPNIIFLEHNFVKFCKHAKGLNIYDAEKQIIYIY
jgi:hypothetical protein